MRTFFIWLFGLLGFGLVGSLLGAFSPSSDAGFGGFLAGMALFSCARLWLGQRPLGM